MNLMSEVIAINPRLVPSVQQGGPVPETSNGTKPKAKRISGAERRRVILTSAREVFQRSGFDGARIKEIAERAGTAEAMIYRHFPSKRDLFNEAILAPLEQWLSLLPEAAEGVSFADTNAERRALMCQTNSELIRATAEVLPLLGVALFSNPDQGHAFYNDSLRPVLASFMEACTKGFEGWHHRPVDVRVWTMLAWGFALANAIDAHLGGTSYDSDWLAAELVDIISRGVASEPARPKRAGKGKAPRPAPGPSTPGTITLPSEPAQG
jgi:AcrR family transcriptional regulator